jgi:hypothetical protein
MEMDSRPSTPEQKQAKRLYGRSLISHGYFEISRRVVLPCLLLLPILAAGVNVTCLRQTRAGADPYWNDVARYLAGMEVSEKSILLPKTKEPRYQNHRHFMDNLWSRIQKETIDIVTTWRKQNVPALWYRATAFYPLSGADFINLYTMFPHARNYLMIAMEPEGDASVLRDCQSRRLIDGLVPVQRSIYLYGVNNYFQSKIMAQEMTNTLLPGTAPALLIFMARLGLAINSVENICISESGELAPAAAQGTARIKGKIYGIRIGFTGNDGSSRELVYLAMKIGPQSVSPDTPEGKYLDRLKRIKTMMKSAVFLLHHHPFDPVRDFILKRSILVVEDDSGIPYKFFSEGWRTTIFGIYRPAIQLPYCKPVYQNDLKLRYAADSKPLPFNFGYGILFGQGQSNLMVAVKK